MNVKTSEERISSRVRSRTFFDVILLLIAQEMDEHCSGFEDEREEKEYLFGLFREHFSEKQDRQPADTEGECMGKLEVDNFEKFQMPFGKYEGTSIIDVPLSYLCFLTDETDPYKAFFGKLKRYMKTPRVVSEIENE